MMTVIDEFKSMNKYSYLVFVEFLEMLCRIALIHYQEGNIEYKVYRLLLALWNSRYGQGIWEPHEHPLIPVVEE